MVARRSTDIQERGCQIASTKRKFVASAATALSDPSAGHRSRAKGAEQPPEAEARVNVAIPHRPSRRRRCPIHF